MCFLFIRCHPQELLWKQWNIHSVSFAYILGKKLQIYTHYYTIKKHTDKFIILFITCLNDFFHYWFHYFMKSLHVYPCFSPQSSTRKLRPCKHYWAPSVHQWLVFTPLNVSLHLIKYNLRSFYVTLLAPRSWKTSNDANVLRH